MKMTNEKRQVLITECHQRIKELEGLDGRRGGISKRAELQLDINRIALAALTAEPVKVPDEKDRNMIAHVYLDETTIDKPDAYVRGFNACRAEVLRLNK